VLVFSSGHFLRILAARYIGLEAGCARHLVLGTASLSVLGHGQHSPAEPAIELWNDTSHLKT
jgi:probable phosphoglycerate mutase